MKLQGSCIIFTAIKKITYDDDEYAFAVYEGDYYISEPLEATKIKLSNGLLKLGIKCLNLSVEWFDTIEGNAFVKFNCECDDSLTILRDMYVQGLKTYEWEDEETSILEINFKV